MAEVRDEGQALRAAYSTVHGSEIARRLAETHDLGGEVRCVLIRRGFNDVYAVTAPDGRRYAARLSGPHTQGGFNVEHETALLDHLKRRGVAVAAPVALRDGGLWRNAEAPEGPRALVLFDFLPGAPPMTDLGDVALMGQELAAIHAEAAAFAGPASLQRLDLDHLVRRPVAAVLAAPHLDQALRDDVAAAADETLRRLDRHGDLTHVACHGDCHGFNTLMQIDDRGARRAAFFDFDDGGPGPLAYDLGVYLWNILQRLGTRPLEDRHRQVFGALLDGYRRRAPTPEPDLAAIPAFVRARELWFLGQYAKQLDYWGSENFAPGWLLERLAALDAWDVARPFATAA
jgi:Ser/Thr protein kinase RdoA (MazF antagonist)